MSTANSREMSENCKKCPYGFRKKNCGGIENIQVEDEKCASFLPINHDMTGKRRRQRQQNTAN